MLLEEYKRNELLNQNYTFDEAIDLYDKRKRTQSLSFNSYIEYDLNKRTPIQKKLERWCEDHYIDDQVDYDLYYNN